MTLKPATGSALHGRAGPHPWFRWAASVAGLCTVETARRIMGTIWLTSVTAVVLLGLAVNVGPSFGLEVFAVRGGSMAPTIPVGAVVVASRTAPETIQVGDIVTIRAENGVVFTHRVVEVDASEPDRWLHTKGDANATPDGVPVPVASVVGVVAVSIPLAGYLMAMLASPTGMVSFVSYAVALLLVLWVLEDEDDDERVDDAIGDGAIDGSPDGAKA